MTTPNTTPAATPRSVCQRRRTWRRLGVIAVATAVIVPGVAVAQIGDDPPAGPVSPPPNIPGVEAAASEQARSVPVTADNEATHAGLHSYFDQLQQIVDSQQFAPPGQPQLVLAGDDMSAGVDSVREMIDDLDAAELSTWAAITEANPGWSQQPRVLESAIAANPYDLGELGAPSGYRAPAVLSGAAMTATGDLRATVLQTAAAMAPAGLLRATGDPDGIYSDCEIDQPNIRGLFYSAWIATQVAGAAGALAAGVPDSVDWVPLLIVAGVAFGVANGIAIALNHALTFALDCAAAKDDAEFRKTLPTDPTAVTPTNPTGITPGSTQTSVDELSSAIAGVATTLTTVDNEIIQILNDQLAILEAFGVAANSASQAQATAENLQERAKDVDANIGTANDQAVEDNRLVDCQAAPPPGSDPCNTANGLANTTDLRLDTIISDTADLEALALRMTIERALADPSRQPLALYALPNAQGGHLELVRDVVALTIANLAAAGQSTGNASATFASANAAFAAGDFVGAYLSYARAYQAAVR